MNSQPASLTPDLLSLVLTLAPLATEPAAPERSLPVWWGRAAHALLLDVAKQADPALSARLHDAPSGPRPYTVSNLIGPGGRRGLVPGSNYSLRFTALQADVSAMLLQAAAEGPLAAGKHIQLDYVFFEIRAAAWDSAVHPWAGSASYSDLGAAYLLAKQPPPRRITLQFASPTTFKSNELHVPIPLPGLAFGSLLDRWNAFAPITFPPEVRRYAEECLAVSRYELHSRPVVLKESGLRVGGVGQVSYTAVNYDRYWMSVIAALASFAQYSGAGAGTAMGLGQCRSQAEES